jgi:hypothetical protein
VVIIDVIICGPFVGQLHVLMLPTFFCPLTTVCPHSIYHSCRFPK